MRQIPLLIRNHETEAAAKRANFARLSQALHEISRNALASGSDRGTWIDVLMTEPDASAFRLMTAQLVPLREQLQADVAACERQRATLIESRVDPVRSLRDAEAELQERFNFRCCDTLEEFQQSHERALTRQRHLKLNS